MSMTGANPLAMLLQQALGGGIGNSQAGPPVTPPTFDPTLQGAPDPTAGLGGGGGNPLAALMAQAGPAPTASPAPMQVPPTMEPPAQAPTKAEGPDLAPFKAKAADLDQQIAQLTQQTQQLQQELSKPISSDIPPELLSFDKYNEAKYQETYGGHGALGVAGRALANFLSGVEHKGTLKDQLTAQNQKDWQLAI